MRERARGFTLLEVLLTIFLMGTLMFALAFNNRQFDRSVQGRGVANATLAELRAARAYAQQHQTNVALAFSTNGSNFFRRFVGEEVLVEERVINLVSQGAGCVLWPDLDDAVAGEPVPPTLDVKNLDGLGYVLFTRDGSAFSNGPNLGINANLLTCVSYQGEAVGDRVKINQVRDPAVIQVSPSGSVRLAARSPEELENLPDSSTPPPVAELGAPFLKPTVKPTVEKVEFSPKRATNAESVGLGRSYIEIFPLDETTAGQKEFPTLTISVEASSPSGAPLFLSGTVEGSDSGDGFFSNIQEVRMDWDGARWLGSLSWKPPYDAKDGHYFDFTLTVADQYGNEVKVEEHAGLKLKAEVLTDVRILLQTVEDQIYLTNAQGGEPKKVTPENTTERRPFWSASGTTFFALEPTEGTSRLIRYTADGEEREVLNPTIPNSLEKIAVDPTGFYFAYTSNKKSVSLAPTATPSPAPTPALTPPEPENVYQLSAAHVSSKAASAVVLETDAGQSFSWSTKEPGELHFSKKVIIYPPDPFEPLAIDIRQEYINLDDVDPDPNTNRRLSSPLYPPVAGGLFNPAESLLFARVKEEDGQPDRLLLVTLDQDGKQVSETEVFQGTSIPEITWSFDGEQLIVVKDNELFSVSKTGAETKIMDAAGKSRFRMAPNNEVIYYIEGAKLYSWKDGIPTRIALKLPDVVDYAITE